MDDLEEVDVSKNINENDDEIQLSEPENSGIEQDDELEEGEVLEDEPEDPDVKKDYELEEGEVLEDESQNNQQNEHEDEDEDENEDENEDDLEEGEIYEGDDEEIKKQNQIQLDELSISKSKEVKESDESDVSDSDDDNDIELQKIESDIDKSTLLIYHPELKQINYKELLTLSKITKNRKGIINDPLHKTIPFLTRYEKAKILGLRAKQINHGSEPFVDVPRNIINGHTIALMELEAKKIPFIIKRPIPNGGNEYWKVSDLQVLE